MELFNINPYVRFARIQKNVSRYDIVGLDHRIFYCTHGEGTITVNGQHYVMKPDSFLFIRSGIPYRNTSQTEGMVLLAYNFDLFCKKENMGPPISFTYACDYHPNMLIEAELSEITSNIPDVLYLPKFFKKEIFEEIVSEYNRREIFYKERCGTLLKDTLLSAMRLKENHSSQKGKGAEILSYIKAHFAEPITNATVAEHFSYHENYINQIFKQQTGQTLHQYLLEYRVKVAITFLKSGEYNVSEVSDLVGFPEISHFTKCFKKITGQVPSLYIPSK